jgi:uncharacterized protein (TIGR02271 family)
MKGFFGLFDGSDNEKPKDEEVKESKITNENTEEQKMKLRKEELNVAKNKADIGKVEVGKEIIEEQQVINVPVVHEEVIVERKTLNETSDTSIEPQDDDERFSLSVGEEKVEVGKNTIVTGEISAHKREVEEDHEIKENIKREQARIYKDGDVNIVDE